MPGFAGSLNLYLNDQQVGNGEIVTQPGVFCLVGDGICVGRDSASPVTPDYQAPFRFTSGTIDKVVGYGTHEASGGSIGFHAKRYFCTAREASMCAFAYTSTADSGGISTSRRC